MPETRTGTETHSRQTSNGPGRHRGQADAAEESRQDAHGRHRRPNGQSEQNGRNERE